MGFLVFQTYWGIATIRDNRWGTRAATVDGTDPDQDALTVIGAGQVPNVGVQLDLVGRDAADLLPTRTSVGLSA